MTQLRQQLRSLLHVEPREGGFVATMRVDPNLLVLPDHFPNQPILPGFCMVQAMLIASGVACGGVELHLTELKNAKLMQPIHPGETITFDATLVQSDDELAVRARLLVDGRRCADLSLNAGAVA